MLRSQYALAIVRLVNGVVDSLQKGKTANSVARLAFEAGLPRILVDLRHETTHNELPSLTALRLGAKQALTWLEERYWSGQAANLASSEEKNERLVGKYFESHLMAARASSEKSEKNISDSDDDLEQVEWSNRGSSMGHLGKGQSRWSSSLNEVNTEQYDPIAARRHRQTYLSELKTSIPRPCSSLLVKGLVDALSAALENSEGNAPQEVVVVALRNTLTNFQKRWPDVGLLVLAAVLEDVNIAAERRDHTTVDRRKEKKDSSLVVNTMLQICITVLMESNGLLPNEEDVIHFSLLRIIRAHFLLLTSSSLQMISVDEDSERADATKRSGERLAMLADSLLIRLKDERTRKRLKEMHSRIKSTSWYELKEGEVEDQHNLSEMTAALDVPEQKRKSQDQNDSNSDREDQDAREKRKKWRRLDAWRPCALGMLPHPWIRNGALPLLIMDEEKAHASQTEREKIQTDVSYRERGRTTDRAGIAGTELDRVIEVHGMEDSRYKEGALTTDSEGSMPLTDDHDDVEEMEDEDEDVAFHEAALNEEEIERSGRMQQHDPRWCPPVQSAKVSLLSF